MTGAAITRLTAREVLDCRGLPTLQVDCWVDERFLGRADVPAGRSRGSHEMVEARDGGMRFGGLGVRGAVKCVAESIAPSLLGMAPWPHRAVDQMLCDLDGTDDKHKLGANAICGVSLAVARAAAASLGLPLYRYLNPDAHVLPVPQVNLINGGRHASGSLDFQEFIIMPVGAATFMGAMEIASEVNLALRQLLAARHSLSALNVGDEGGCTPALSDPRQALSLLHEAVDAAGYSRQVVYGLDCAATHLFDAKTATYSVGGKRYSSDELLELYLSLIDEFHVASIEDPFQEEDFEAFAQLTNQTSVQVVGDDLLATQVARIQKGVELNACNALLWKVNQVGTLSEAMDAAHLARLSGWALVVSERSGETEDTWLSDLTVALSSGQIKTGAPVRGERTSKYNRLLLIEEELGSCARYAGTNFRRPI